VDDGRVIFRCSNRLESLAIPDSNKDGGVGISNVQNRLALLYDTDYTLECGADKDVYNVLMSIPVLPKGGIL
jgi:LytS/YehU family sensor histidine kinase